MYLLIILYNQINLMDKKAKGFPLLRLLDCFPSRNRKHREHSCHINGTSFLIHQEKRSPDLIRTFVIPSVGLFLLRNYNRTHVRTVTTFWDQLCYQAEGSMYKVLIILVSVSKWRLLKQCTIVRHQRCCCLFLAVDPTRNKFRSVKNNSVNEAQRAVA